MTDVREVLADFVLASQIKQRRLMRVLGAEHAWSMSSDTGTARIGDATFPLDVVGTESAAVRTWVWAWANPSFAGEHTLTAALVRRVGVEWDVEALARDDEIPLDRIDAHQAGSIAAGIGEADAYYAGHHDEGAVVFLLRGRILREAPFTTEDVASALDMLVDGSLGVEPRAALQGFADEPLDGFEAEVHDRGAALRGAGAEWRLDLDRRGRVAHVEVRAGADAPEEDGEGDEDEELTVVGTLELPGGPIAIFDPLLAVDPVMAEPRPAALPAGRYDVAVGLEEGRVAVAHLLLGDAEPAWWQPVGSVFADSGIACFATPAAGSRVAEGERGVVPLGEALDAAQQPTWTAAAADGLVAFSTGYGTGEYDIHRGFDAEDRLVRIAVVMLPEDEPWPAGQERAALFPLAAGGDLAEENLVPLPPAAHRRLTAVHRRMFRASFEGHELEAEVVPEYDGGGDVPSRVRVSVEAGAASFTETIEV